MSDINYKELFEHYYQKDMISIHLLCQRSKLKILSRQHGR